MIFFIKPDISPGVPFPEVSSNGFQLPRGVFQMGARSISEFIPGDLVFGIEDGIPDVSGLLDYMCGVGWIVVSEHLRSILEEVGAGIEYIPVKLSHHGVLREGYFIANILHRISCVDVSASAIELDELGFAYSAEKIILDESKLLGLPVAIVRETGHVAVQDDVAERIRKSGCKGCNFVLPVTEVF